jgi:rhodanese-related sulfurtransferase
MHKINKISAQELKEICDHNKHPVIIDVREQYEWDDGHMPHAKHIPMQMLSEKITSIVPDVDTPVYLHCKGGVRSMQCAENLAKLGYKKLYSLDGGIMAWQNAGYPVVTKK